jgi:type II secretory ATPase GspE/PulE/Tfp pilus assembly ATPase PilB-like protein
MSGKKKAGASTEDLRATAIRQGMTPMAMDGIRKAATGTTTLGEVFRVLGSER